ncbi:MAG: carbamoyltransferase HypF [Sterolibacteriaceae bacterium]|uniref:Carbamoyltransferase HypF n=1 Tax=Candidatus Methylophosphatis roskildensis TaxID=2899263 RepID=A0A9D7E684_9PROT|nr:carbamoyltransferase HypF [Candidatus Methylophosphatis roskildensis]
MLMDSRIHTHALHLRCRGLVQGVGFRPFVWRLATELNLQGHVRNDGDGVFIEVCGKPSALAVFRERLAQDAPPRSRIEHIEVETCTCTGCQEGFVIADSAPAAGGQMRTAIGPDSAVCDDCLIELFNPRDRRYRYPFINCTQCGPRYTITRSLPYDRARTSMSAFTQCPTCESEYRDPAHRRFHAEPNACPSCGPRLWLADASGTELVQGDVIVAALGAIQRGEIVAIKGLGGFHLACDACNGEAVARLRSRKQREEKPFALMLAGTESAREFVHVGEDERALLDSPERPIVLLEKRPGADEMLPGVAPGLAWLGVMLPYTPLHYLLFHQAAGRLTGTAWLDSVQPLVLVMTSANPHGEPLVADNDEAIERLRGIGDFYLMHDREIVARCDDSVITVRSEEGGARREAAAVSPHPSPLTPDPLPLTAHFVRRARGYTPRPIRLARWVPPVLAFGAWYKNSVALTRGDEAFVSPHIGDLDNAATCEALLETIEHMQVVLDVTPQFVAHDLHPDFFSTRAAVEYAQKRGLQAVGVQHHHAHVAAVLAEHRVDQVVLGLALDGVGLGSDGAAWGGELLRVDGARFERLGHLRKLALPGADRAAREPWRMAASALHALGQGDAIGQRFAHQAAADAICQMLERASRCPTTSSMGRWFDAAAGLLGVRDMMSFEGQAAMLLEGLAEEYGEVAAEDSFAVQADGTLDLLPLLAALSHERDATRGAARFHATLIAALDAWVWTAAQRTGIRTVALGGGCFLNRIVSRGLSARLDARGLKVLAARAVPPNDGGLALGQAWVAAQHFMR